MKKILLIEDNLEVRENTAELLELAGYEVITAPEGKTGVERTRMDSPDLIICDIMMPVLDGYGVLHLLSKDATTACIPFIFLTAKADKTDFRKGMNLGADDYLTKPFDELELMSTIERRLNRIEKLKAATAGTPHPTEKLNSFISESQAVAKLQNLTLDRESREYEKKQLIYREGASPVFLFYLTTGLAKRVRMNEWGKELIVEMHKAGDFVGYLDLLKNSAYSDSLIALEDCTVSAIPKNDFFTLLYQDRDVSAQFVKLLSGNVTEREQGLLDMAYDSVRSRVAKKIVDLCSSTPTGSFSLGREDLANLVGTSKETLIRTISEFKECGAIEVDGAEIKLLKVTELDPFL
ncbi:response regulator [Chitinophagales bacterium]|nr:response regulator [Chitinophagales bacterium]